MRTLFLVVIIWAAADCAAPVRVTAPSTIAAATQTRPTTVVMSATPVPARLTEVGADAPLSTIPTQTPTPALVSPTSDSSVLLAPAPELTRALRGRAYSSAAATSATPIAVNSRSDLPTPTAPDPKPTRGVRGTPRAPHKTPAPAAIPGVSVVTDVPYVERPGCDPHQISLDIYIPAAAQNLPVLIYVHGGGWSAGDHEPVGAKAAYFTARGFIFVSVNYRLAPAARPAEQAADVAAAVAWVKENVSADGGDGERLFLLGHSAGAHLSALIASDETYLQGVGLKLSAIRGVILLDSAAYDVEQLMRSPEGQGEPFLPIFGADPAAWRPVSPRAHVAPGKGIPPHLILLATAQGQRRPAAAGLAAALRAAGVYAQIADATAFSDHGAINEKLGRPGDTPTAAVQTFLDMLLAGPPIGLGGVEVLRPTP